MQQTSIQQYSENFFFGRILTIKQYEDSKEEKYLCFQNIHQQQWTKKKSSFNVAMAK